MKVKCLPKEFEKNIFLVDLVAIIFDTKTRKVLIGKKENDPIVKKLGWCFPNGIPKHGDDLRKVLVNEVKRKTGLKIVNLGSISSRTFPERKNILNIYYLCESVGGKEKAGGSLKELKWVKPTELKKYFKTSLSPQLKEYLNNLK